VTNAEEKQLVTARLAEKQKEALAKKAEEAQMKLLEEERTREERRQVSTHDDCKASLLLLMSRPAHH